MMPSAAVGLYNWTVNSFIIFKFIEINRPITLSAILYRFTDAIIRIPAFLITVCFVIVSLAGILAPDID